MTDTPRAITLGPVRRPIEDQQVSTSPSASIMIALGAKRIRTSQDASDLIKIVTRYDRGRRIGLRLHKLQLNTTVVLYRQT